MWTGFLVAKDGSENHLIKIGSNYIFSNFPKKIKKSGEANLLGNKYGNLSYLSARLDFTEALTVEISGFA